MGLVSLACGVLCNVGVAVLRAGGLDRGEGALAHRAGDVFRQLCRGVHADGRGLGGFPDSRLVVRSASLAGTGF